MFSKISIYIETEPETRLRSEMTVLVEGGYQPSLSNNSWSRIPSDSQTSPEINHHSKKIITTNYHANTWH